MQKFLFILLVASVPFTTIAQIGGLVNRAKAKVESRINKNVDEKMDKALDQVEGKKSGTNSGGTAAAASEEETPSEKAGVTSYAKFDFVPGSKVIYAEDFSQDEIGELPLGWNTNNRGEVVTLNGIPGKWMRLIGNSSYLSSSKDTFSRNFSVEFDLVYNIEPNGYVLPSMKFGFLSTNDEAANDNKFLKQQDIYQQCEITMSIYPRGKKGYSEKYAVDLQTFQERVSFFNAEAKSIDDLGAYANKVSHVSVQVQGTRLRLWVNGFKAYDLPMALPVKYNYNQLFFELENSNYKDEEIGYYISNIKVASGKPDTRHKLLDEGKFSTTGILFNVQSAVIKPESYGVLKEIASVMKEHASVRLKIIGHTSSDGDDAANMELSRQRAAAVKDLLVKEHGIDASRLETEGKGETQPVADNKTEEGKAQNRRVEFIKL
ncbi:MAG TPA: OmpA family protein [Chitinophagaceae bacterium]|nr:OmpA family protein [Chitinophagaceae bacterium]